MSDLIRAIESDLFGSYEWAADLYEDLRAVPEAADRLAIMRGLMRAYENLEDRAEDGMKAADGLVAAEAELAPDEAEAVAALDDARDDLLETASPEAAAAFVAAFTPRWEAGPRDALVADAILAALAKSNVLASRQKGGDPRALHRESADLYDAISGLLQARLTRGETLWQETAAAAVNRRVVALRLAGEDESAKRLAAAMGAGEYAKAPNERPAD